MGILVRLASECDPASSQEQRFRCFACDTRIIKAMLINIPVDVYVAQIDMLRCPSCGAGPDEIALGEGRKLSEDRAERSGATESERAADWLANGETGLSSTAICYRMIGWPQGQRKHHPVDPDDMRRCMLLLDRMPEWRARIGEMAALSPGWAALSPVWVNLENTFFRESANLDGPAPQTHAAIKAALEVAA